MLIYMIVLDREFPFVLATLIIQTGVFAGEDAGEAVSATRRLSRLG